MRSWIGPGCRRVRGERDVGKWGEIDEGRRGAVRFAQHAKGRFVGAGFTAFGASEQIFGECNDCPFAAFF